MHRVGGTDSSVPRGGEEGFSAARRWAARIATPAAAKWATDLADAIRSEDPDDALHAGLSAVDAKVAAIEIARTAALAYGESVDVAKGSPLRGLVGLASGVRLARHLAPALQPLPVLRGLALAAMDAKLPHSERRKRIKVSGEISHLTRSFEYAVRTGAFADAVSIFSGLLTEGKERVMAGDILFRVAAEDMVNGGQKLVYSVKAWQLASALGWRAGDVVTGPMIARVATGIQDPAAYKTLMAVWRREKVDIAAIGGNAGAAEGAERDAILTALRSGSPEECAKDVILALKRGVALDAVAQVAVREAALRVSAAGTYDVGAIGGLVYADAARWVLRFSKTETRVLPLLQACVVLRSQATKPAEVRAPPMGVRDIETLVYQVCKGGPDGNLGPNLNLADAAADEATAYPSTVKEGLGALARAIAQSPRDDAAWPALEKRFPPPTSF